MTTIQFTLATLLLAAASSAVVCQSSISESVAESHIRANVPDDKDFHRFLKRDLELYFKESKKKDVVVEYQLLRDGPTQAGIAFPKFYAWVKIKENDTLLEEGAVRVAAMEKKNFGVYDYLTRSDIVRDFEKVYRVFPKPVADRIKQRVSR